MNAPTIRDRRKLALRDRLIEKLNYLSDRQLESIWQFVERIESQLQKVNIFDRSKDLLTKFDNLWQETQALHLMKKFRQKSMLIGAVDRILLNLPSLKLGIPI